MTNKLIIIQDVTEQYVHKIEEVIPEWEIIATSDRSAWVNHFKDAEIIVGWNKAVQEFWLKNDTAIKWIQS